MSFVVTQRSSASERERVVQLAERMGVQAHYVDGRGEARVAPFDTVVAAMRALGAPLRSVGDTSETRRWWKSESALPSPVAPIAVHHAAPCPRVGAFLPLYALRSERSIGVGDLGDLARLAEGCQRAGYGFVATLPLFAGYIEREGQEADFYDPSPYAPVSRSFFNELYLDLRATDEWDSLSPTLLAEVLPPLEIHREARLLDVGEVARLRRQLIEPMSHAWRGQSTPAIEAYARARGGDDPSARLYHRYVQAMLNHQLTALTRKHALYLDLPVGVHPAGFDAQRFPGDFLTGFSAGAPPDEMFTTGQTWNITALHPLGARRSGYAAFRAAVSTLAPLARVLRLDHVMALQRTFCVPDGAEASDGVYIHARSEELFSALLASAAEAEHPPVLVGEDLGTVAPEVRAAMAARGVLRMHVMQLAPEDAPPEGSCASINTHDMPTYAGYAARAPGASTYADVRERLLQSAARHVVINLEDEWGETEPQNVPGTSMAQPNFRRRARPTLDEMLSLVAPIV